MSGFDINAVVGTLIKEYVAEPDYTELREEIAKHADDFVVWDWKPKGEPRKGLLNREYKVIATTKDCVVLQELQMTWNKTRFQVHVVELKLWGEYFVEWLTPEDEKYQFLGVSCWEDGARMYGARV
jgi:hypothetical protein